MTLIKKTAGIILAAGTASRMGKTKQLLPFDGTTLLGRVMENAARSNLHELVIVLGHDAETIIKTVDLSAAAVIVNPDYARGQGASLIKGIAAVSASSAGAMFLLADQPLITAAIINQMVAAFQASEAPIIIPFCRGRRGNPVIISRSLFPRLSSLSADTGARALFDAYQHAIEKVEIENDAVLFDVDTPADYETLLARVQSGV